MGQSSNKLLQAARGRRSGLFQKFMKSALLAHARVWPHLPCLLTSFHTRCSTQNSLPYASDLAVGREVSLFTCLVLFLPRFPVREGRFHPFDILLRCKLPGRALVPLPNGLTAPCVKVFLLDLLDLNTCRIALVVFVIDRKRFVVGIAGSVVFLRRNLLTGSRLTLGNTITIVRVIVAFAEREIEHYSPIVDQLRREAEGLAFKVEYFEGRGLPCGGYKTQLERVNEKLYRLETKVIKEENTKQNAQRKLSA